MIERYFSKFKFTDKFDSLPEQMELNARGHLCLTHTKIDMVPAGLKGIYFIFMAKKPRYVATDFKGVVMYEDSGHIKDMDNLDIQEAKARYSVYREMVEKPRYIKEEDGSLSLCSLPTDMRIFHKPFVGYCLDLRQTSVKEKQNLGGFKEIILYPKRPVQMEFDLTFPKKLAHHKGRQMVHQKPRIKE